MAGSSKTSTRVLQSIVYLILLIGAGVGIMLAFVALKKEPPRVETTERRLKVVVKEVKRVDAEVAVVGYGSVRPLDTVVITPKVAGEVLEMHPRLDMGEIIAKDELLFRIDAKDYEIARDQAQAQVARLEATLTMLTRKFADDTKRMETYRRTKELAGIEFERDKQLFEEDDIGTESMVHFSETQFNTAQDAFDQIEQAIDLYPLRVKEAESGLAAAKSQLEQANLALSRTELRAPFDARVKLVQVEVGQNVAPGTMAVVLANDATMEISVPLEGRDAAQWLRFKQPTAKGKDGVVAAVQWFGDPEPVPCRISWAEDPGKHSWWGTLSRVERVDQVTRTVSVCVRVEGASAGAEETGMPLVEGMFCKVEIPGKKMEQVYQLPRWVVTFEDELYVAAPSPEGPRLERRLVEVLRRQGEDVFVDGGIEPGEQLIVTRLQSPLPGTLLEIEEAVESSAVADKNSHAPDAVSKEEAAGS